MNFGGFQVGDRVWIKLDALGRLSRSWRAACRGRIKKADRSGDGALWFAVRLDNEPNRTLWARPAELQPLSAVELLGELARDAG